MAATDAIAEVVEVVEKMLASGAAYVVDDAEYPDVYFRADATVQFGYESGYDHETMRTLFAERGGDPRPRRQEPTNSTRCSGAPSDPASRPGRHRSGRAGPAGMSSARRSRSPGWVWASTSRAAAVI